LRPVESRSILGSVDISAFLQAYPPFDALDDEQLTGLVRHTHIEFFLAKQVILRQSGEPAHFLYVVRSGAVERVDGDQILEILGPGELFGHPSMLSGLGPIVTMRAHEDTLCYLVDPETAEEVLKTRAGLIYLAHSFQRRVRAMGGAAADVTDPLRTPARDLIERVPLTCDPSTTVREVARLMSENRVSAVLVPRGGGWGIVTDRDLRSRVLAAGKSLDTPIQAVATFPVVTVGADTLAAEMAPLMIERGFHHLPVVSDDGQLLGLVTDHDLVWLEEKAPFALKTTIERAADEDEVVAAGRELPEAVCALVRSGVDALEVTRVMAATIDSITRRLLELGVRRLGDPPARWAWLGLGSLARQEQSLVTDQDHALAYDADDVPSDLLDPYFAKLAEFVTAGLERIGIPRCRAGVIASNREWRGSLGEWEFRFRRWMSDPGRVGSAFTGITFDYRELAGPLEVEPALDAVIRSAATNKEFLRHLASQAVNVRLPGEAALDGREGPIDLKHAGTSPINNIARAYAIAAGLTENRTVRRLREVTRLGRMPEETCKALEESFSFLWQVRLDHQTQMSADGIQPDDLVDPRELGPVARQGLKEAFRTIERARVALGFEMGMRVR
jgi:CBS domain-containing protein